MSLPSLSITLPSTRPYLSFFELMTVTVLPKTKSERLCYARDPKSCEDSGASMPSRRILCWRLSASNTVIVSPSLTPTTLPIMVCGCHVGSKLEIRVGVGDDRAINTAELVGGGSIALQATSNRPKTHAAHLFGLPDLSFGSSVIV